MAAAAILNFGKMSITPDWIKISAPNFTGIVEASNFKFGTQLGTLYLFLQPLKLAISNLVHNLVLGLAYQKTFWTKIGGGLESGPGEHPKKIGTPYVFLQPLKPATSNLVHN